MPLSAPLPVDAPPGGATGGEPASPDARSGPVRLFAAAAGVVTLVLLVVCAALLTFSYESAQRRAQVLTRGAATALTLDAGRAARAIDVLLADTAAQLAAPGPGLQNLLALSEQLHLGPQLRGLMGTDAAGGVIYSTDPAALGGNVAAAAWFASVRANPDRVVVGLPAPEDAARSLLFARARLDAQGQFAGVVAVRLDPVALMPGAAELAEAFALDVRLYASGGMQLFGTFSPGEGRDPRWRGGLDGAPPGVQVDPVADSPFTVALSLPPDVALAPFRRDAVIVGAGFGVALAASLTGLFLLFRQAETLRRQGGRTL